METRTWIKDLKMAVIQRDSGQIAKLYETMPDFTKEKFSLETLQLVEPLIKSAIDILKAQVGLIRKQMDYVKAAGAYQQTSI